MEPFPKTIMIFWIFFHTRSKEGFDQPLNFSSNRHRDREQRQIIYNRFNKTNSSTNSSAGDPFTKKTDNSAVEEH